MFAHLRVKHRDLSRETVYAIPGSGEVKMWAALESCVPDSLDAIEDEFTYIYHITTWI